MLAKPDERVRTEEFKGEDGLYFTRITISDKNTGRRKETFNLLQKKEGEVVSRNLDTIKRKFKPADKNGPVSFWGSTRCESGSLASGGMRSYCTCDTCF